MNNNFVVKFSPTITGVHVYVEDEASASCLYKRNDGTYTSLLPSSSIGAVRIEENVPEKLPWWNLWARMLSLKERVNDAEIRLQKHIQKYKDQEANKLSTYTRMKTFVDKRTGNHYD